MPTLPYGDGPQGWLNPMEEPPIPNNHNMIFQYNLENIDDPFTHESLDMAFVITGHSIPIPGAFLFLSISLIGLAGIKRKFFG